MSWSWWTLVDDNFYQTSIKDDQKQIKGDFDIRSMKGILKGGESGKPGLVKGKAKESFIYQSVLWLDEDLEMPPKKNDKLSKDQTEIIKKWINDGAPNN